MKLIEKLAIQFRDQNPDLVCNWKGCSCDSFVAGFRKALEMAALLAAREEGSTAYWITRIGEEEAE